jgi:hypothetical protein
MRCKQATLGLSALALSSYVFAEDKLATALTGDVQDMLGGSGFFWKIFILVDVILAVAAYIKSKNPMAFLGTFFVIFVPAFFLRLFVFA